MHDWTLVSAVFDWGAGDVTLSFDSATGAQALVARLVAELSIPRRNEWGRSASVNEVKGLTSTPDNLQCLEIEMQSGDVIRIAASSFQMPICTSN